MDPRLTDIAKHAERLEKSSYQLAMKLYTLYGQTWRDDAERPQHTALYDLARDIQAAVSALSVALEKIQRGSTSPALRKEADPTRDSA